MSNTRVAPSVYLDTCALRDIAEDKTRCEQFVRVLLSKRGTLVLSALSVGEVSNQDPRHAAAIGALIDRVYPYLFFQEYDPFVVMQAERERWLDRQNKSAPDADCKYWPLIAAITPPFGGDGTFAEPYKHITEVRKAGGDERIRRLGAYVLAEMESVQQKPEVRQRWRAYVRPNPKRKQPDWATKGLAGVMMLHFCADQKRKYTVNDGVDFFHAVVPAAYCDFIVLDKAWCTRVKQAAKAMEKALIEAPIAMTYSVSDFDTFLADLERYEARPRRKKLVPRATP